MNLFNSPYLGFYLMGVFINTVIFVFSYDIDGVAKKLCTNKVKKIIGIISVFFYIPFLIVLIKKEV